MKEIFLLLLVGVLFCGSVQAEKPTAFDLAFNLGNIKENESNGLKKPIESQVIYYLYTRKVSKEVITPDVKKLRQSHLLLDRKVNVIIHGFFDNVNRPMPQNIKNNLLQVEDSNVIIVDWGKIAIGINYYKIAKKSKDVGDYLAKLIKSLVKIGVKPKNIHLIGHSLGAHIAGLAGSQVTPKVGRITGLDPAKPLFEKVDPSKRLSSSDAEFVDCVHTCGGLLGLYEPIGHADFYPNGGKNMQPGCHFYDFGRCSHIRAHEYFAESILPTHVFPSEQCSALDMVDSCQPSQVKMGYYAQNWARGVFTVKTQKKPPYSGSK